MTGPFVSFEDVSLGYGRKPVVAGVNFVIPRGDFLGIVGPNGSGKTTIIRALLGTLGLIAGTISKQPGIRFGYVPQRDHVDSLYPLTVDDVVIMGRYHLIPLGRRPTDADRVAAGKALEQAGIGHLAKRSLASLSGGQKQRTLIARALVGDPDILVLDEPTNGMDLVSTTQILSLIRELHDMRGLTVIMVSHALNEVANYVRRIGLVFNGELRLGSVDEIINESVLEGVYGIPVEVHSFEGHRVVVARPTGGSGALPRV